MATISKGEGTKAAILDQALAVASQVGLTGLTIGELAKRVGMSKSGLFAHFASKEELQLEVLQTAVERFVGMVIAPALTMPRGEPRVRKLFDSWLEWERAPFQPGGCLFVAAAKELDDQPGPLRDRLVGYQNDWLQALTTSARIAIAEGHFRPDLDVDQFAYDLFAIILAYHQFSRLLHDPQAEQRARRAFDALVTRCRTVRPA